jgi:hypothetical protein
MTMGPSLLECDSVLVILDKGSRVLGIYGPYTYEQAERIAQEETERQIGNGSTNGDMFEAQRLFRFRTSREDPLMADPIGPPF